MTKLLIIIYKLIIKIYYIDNKMNNMFFEISIYLSLIDRLPFYFRVKCLWYHYIKLDFLMSTYEITKYYVIQR